ncbi:MAG: Helix-turn-helix, AraC protein [Ferruginibacter sp.]|uniref:helix-turn-helix transcriptional regulator n=1 Tax=Ferruginibacter sp. TaxID=1940288 RepID=UPI00265A0F64|nr:helix-turn-helix transcriptional regulator [Ferruginibacter sp.]MDB5277296.1 Helix-turn-helix, AraC protein [Ferruginibacter sp.]
MEKPLHIILQHGDQAGRQQKTQVAGNYLYRIPFASAAAWEGAAGSLLSQAFNGPDYWIELLSFLLYDSDAVFLQVPAAAAGFVFLLQGNPGEQWLAGKKMNVVKGTYAVFYLPPGKYPLALPAGEYHLLCLLPPPGYLNSMALEHPDVHAVLHLLATNALNGFLSEPFYFPKAVLRIIKSMERCTKQGAALDLVLRSYILKLLSFYNQQLKDRALHPLFQTHEQTAFAVRDYILANTGTGSPGRLKEITRLFPITAKTLTREFKKLFGKTVPEFIRDERLDLAHRLLSLQNKQVQEVALAAGYDYFSHFSREFKKKFGYPPGAVLKLHGEGNLPRANPPAGPELHETA